MKAIWSGDIGFGLVSIPVRLFPATGSSELDLELVDRDSHARIRYKRVNEETGKEVPWDHIQRAYELNGRYVVLSEEDFRDAMVEKTRRIDISAFVGLDEVDAIYFENPYYVVPGKNGSVPYRLLAEALKKTNKAGLGTYVMRNREHLALIRAREGYLLLQQLRFAEEIRELEAIDLPARKRPDPAQLKIAVSLIDQMTAEFDISHYKDTYSARLMKLIKARAKGAKTKPQRMKVVPASGDLLSQLKQSLSAGKKRKTS